MARSKTATAEAIFWQAIEAFALRARTTPLDPRSRPEKRSAHPYYSEHVRRRAYFTKLSYFLKRARLPPALNVRFGSKADIRATQSHVRLAAESVRSLHSPYLIVQRVPT